MSVSVNGDSRTLGTLHLLDILRDRIDEIYNRTTGQDTRSNRNHLLFRCHDLLDNVYRSKTEDGTHVHESDSEVQRLRSILLRAFEHVAWCEYTLKMTASPPSSLGLRQQNHLRCFDELLHTLQQLQYPEDAERQEADHHGLLHRASPSLSHTSEVPIASSPPFARATSPMSSQHASQSPASHVEHAVPIKQEYGAEAVDMELYDRAHLRKDSRLGSQSHQSPLQETLPPISAMTMKDEFSNDVPKTWPPLLSHTSPTTPPMSFIAAPTSPPSSTLVSGTTRSNSLDDVVFSASASSFANPPMTLEPRNSYLGSEPPNPFQTHSRQQHSSPS